MNIEKFNLRVYGILINAHNEVLLCDEVLAGHRFTKFPGGGLEFGEGLHDALKREWMEELQTRIEIEEHIYTTDYFQPSAFNPEHQLISIYYKVGLCDTLNIQTSNKEFDFSIYPAICFRWQPIITLSEEMLTFPVDQLVVRKYLK